MRPDHVSKAAAFAELERFDDRMLADIGLERSGPIVVAIDESRVRRVAAETGALGIVGFIATIITKGGFRPA